MKLYTIILLIAITFISSAQSTSFKGYVLDYETHDTVENVNMSLSCYSSLSSPGVYAKTNAHGFFSFPVMQCRDFYMQPVDKKYRQLSQKLYLKDTAGIITYYLHDAAIIGYFQEFQFAGNSIMPLDTSLFGAWWLNEKQDTINKVMLKGYYAPGEKKEVAYKRAKSVFDGFVSRGANPKSFVISTECFNNVRLSYGYHVMYKDVEYFFKKGLTIDESYINTLSGDKREAAIGLLRAVRLSYAKK